MMDHILSIKLVSSSFQVRTTSLDGYRNVRMTTKDSLNTKPSLLDFNFKEFASNYCQTKTGIKKRASSVVIEAYPDYFSSPKGPSYGLFCRYQLLRCKSSSW